MRTCTRTNTLHSFLVSVLLRKWPAYLKKRFPRVDWGERWFKLVADTRNTVIDVWYHNVSTTITVFYHKFTTSTSSVPSESPNSSHERFVVDTTKYGRTLSVTRWKRLSQDSDSLSCPSPPHWQVSSLLVSTARWRSTTPSAERWDSRKPSHDTHRTVSKNACLLCFYGLVWYGLCVIRTVS